MHKSKFGILLGTSLALGLGVVTFGSAENNENNGGVFIRKLEEFESSPSFRAEPLVYDSFAKDNSKYRNGEQDCSMTILDGDSHEPNYIEDVWNAYRGDDITIAIIDTGIDLTHPDFYYADGTSKILDTSRYYYINNGSAYYNALGEAGITNLNFLDHGWNSKDNKVDAHGTNTASAAASAINGLSGTVGIAPNAKLLILKTDMQLTSIYNAIDYATSKNVDVINMSLGFYDSTYVDNYGYTRHTKDYLETPISSAIDKGIIVVAAAGNDNTDDLSYPASNTDVIGVGALGSAAYSKASFSNYNASGTTSSTTHKNVDLSAPGYVYQANETGTYSNGNISNRTHGYTNTQGTSFASPIVAGAAALWKQQNPSGTVSQFKTALFNSCDDINNDGWDTTFGYGALNVKKLLLSDSQSPTSISVISKENQTTIEKNEHLQLYHQTLPLNSANKSVTWSSSNSSIVSVNSSTGVCTGGSTSGTAIITAQASNGVSGSITIANEVVTPVTGISFNNKTISIEKNSEGDWSNFPLTITPSNATNKNVTWSSSDDGLFCVEDDGWMSGDEDGTVTLTARSVSNPEIFDTCTVKIGSSAQETTTATLIDTDFSTYPDSTATLVKDGITYKYEKIGNYDGIQFQGSNGKIYNTTSLVNILNIKITERSGKNHTNLTVGFGNTQSAAANATKTALTTTGVSGGGASYFYISNGSGAANVSSISIEYTTGGSGGDTEKTLSSISLSGYTTSLTVGSPFSFGGTVTAHYSDSSTANVTSSTTFSGYNMSVVDSYTVTASYTESSVTKTATYTLNVASSGGGDPSNYYDSITATGDMALLGQLHDLTCTKHKTYNIYSDDLNTSNYFKTDPFNSNSSYLRDFYSGGQMNNTIVSSGSGGWNREHVWPKSLSGGLFEESGAGADIQHLRPTVASINSDRASKKYGNISGSKTTSSYSFNGTTYVGGYYTTSIFEPIDSKKGDVARIIMYLYMHYNTYTNFKENNVTYATTNGSGSSSYFGTLRFTNVMNASTEAAAIEILLAWNSSDPIDDIERTRNIEAAKITGARNPFIDNSNYANQIWGDEPTPAKTLTSITVSENHRTFAFGSTFTKETVTAHYSDKSTEDVTNSANFSGFDSSTPGQKTITVTYEENDVEVSTTYKVTIQDPIVKSFSLTKDSEALTSLSLDKYSSSSAGIVANITADTGADTSISWTYSKSGVAEVTGSGTNYTVTALSVGTTTVTGNCGGKSASFTVTVTDSTPIPVTNVAISGPTEVLNTSTITLTASITPSTATDKTVTWSVSPSGVFSLTPNGNSVTVSPIGSVGSKATVTATANDGSGKSASQEIEITELLEVTKISLSYYGINNDNKVPFAKYKNKVMNDVSVIATMSNSKTTDVTEFAIKNFSVNCYALGEYTISASYEGHTDSLKVKVTNEGSSQYVGVSSKVTRAGEEYNATPTQQAEAWANYFIEVTGGGSNDGPCKLPENQRASALANVWSKLQDEYGWMADASKDVFCDSETTNTKILEARNHYLYIVKTYSSLGKFVKDSDNNVLSAINTHSVFNNLKNSSIIIAVVAVIVGGAFVLIYLTFRRRKNN